MGHKIQERADRLVQELFSKPSAEPEKTENQEKRSTLVEKLRRRQKAVLALRRKI